MENKIERPEGQFAKRFKVVMDVTSLPQTLGVDMFAKLADSGFIFYDSSKGQRPKLYLIDGEVDPETVPAFVDIKGQELDIEDLKKQWEDEEFWRKELYKCKQSPLYYFTNYVSINPKPSTSEVDAYLESVNMGATEDSGEVGPDVINQRTKEIREKYAASIKLEDLKTLKPVRDRIDGEYELQTEEFIEQVVKEYDLSGKVEKAIKDKIISVILKSKPAAAPQDLKYYIVEKSGRWDKALMLATDLDVLVRLWIQLQKK